jgi:hypothetical protein
MTQSKDSEEQLGFIEDFLVLLYHLNEDFSDLLKDTAVISGRELAKRTDTWLDMTISNPSHSNRIRADHPSEAEH